MVFYVFVSGVFSDITGGLAGFAEVRCAIGIDLQ
jgi:hypothetical protein